MSLPEPVEHLRILVVDDDPLVLKAVGSILEIDGHAVSMAEGGQRGIDMFAAHHASGRAFDAVITDLGMPQVDGRQVAAAIKRLSPGTPILLLTGWGQRMLDDAELPQNIDRILGKPPKMKEVRSALRALCAGIGAA